jgi:hypothetical protein
MAILQPDTQVKFIQPEITGAIVKAEIVDNSIQYLVSYVNDEGDRSERWFKEDELQLV